MTRQGLQRLFMQVGANSDGSFVLRGQMMAHILTHLSNVSTHSLTLTLTLTLTPNPLTLDPNPKTGSAP